MSFFNVLYLVVLFAVFSNAFRTSPNSPCASLCSQTSSTFTENAVCANYDYDDTQKGQQAKQCLSCLQTSSYSSGSESDQVWFLYNLRFALGSCILGFNSSSGSNPCSVSGACGGLGRKWLYGDLNASSVTEMPYGYCTQSLDRPDAESTCLSCVQSDSSESYLSNFIIALQAGCAQKPINGSTLTLSASIFSNATVSASAATASAQATQAAQPSLPLPAIIGIVAGGILVVFGGLAGYLCLRRRKLATHAHQNGLEATLNKREKDAKKKAKRDKRRTLSSLSFRCITRVTPVTPEFPGSVHGHAEKTVSVQTSTRAASPYGAVQDPWNAYLQTQRYTYMPPSTGTFTTCTTTFYSDASSSSNSNTRSVPRGVALPSLTTSVSRAADEFTPTPSSTHSAAPLIKTAASPAAVYVPSGRFASPTSAEPLLSPPLLSPSAWPMPGAAHKKDKRKSSLWFRQREMPRRVSGSPSETVSIKSVFDPPPTRALD